MNRQRARRKRRRRKYVGQPCPYCRRPMMYQGSDVIGDLVGTRADRSPSTDHKTPRSRGGTDAPNNRLVCCTGCNVDKGNLDYDEYRAVLEGRASRIDKGPASRIHNLYRSTTMRRQ